MPQFLAPIINEQQFDANGDPLSGGTISVYLAGTSTQATTYNDRDGMPAHANSWPITLNTLGVNSQGSVWLVGGQAYKFVIRDVNNVVLRGDLDYISGINDTTVTTDQWIVFQGVPTYVSATSFTVPGDQTLILQIGRRLKSTNTGGTVYSTITNSVYSAPNTTVTVANSSGVLDVGLSSVSYGVISPQDTSLPVPYPQMRNLVVNGNFAVNQRVYVSGTNTTVANQVTLDRWRVVTSGQNITFGAAAPDRVVTCPAGGLEQIIEAASVVGGPYVLSWVGTATATVNGVAIANGAQTASLPANTAVTLRLSGGTANLVQFERVYVTPFERRPPGLELALCQRQYQKSYALGTAPGSITTIGAFFAAGNVGSAISVNIRLPVPLMTAANVQIWDINSNANSVVSLDSGGTPTTRSASASNQSESAFNINSGALSTDVVITGHWAASTGV